MRSRSTTRFLCLATLIAVAASSLPAGAREQGTRRTLVEEYAGPALGAWLGNQGSYVFQPDCQRRLGCIPVTPEAGDRFMRVSVKDRVSPNVAYWLELIDTGQRYEYCGESSDVIPVTGERRIWILLPEGTCPDGSPSAATQGEFTIEFASTRKALLSDSGGARR